MEKKEYSVSEAVRLIGVESHVLRYWEEELQVKIRRTSQGHRVYSQENIDTFCKVRELKEHGLQLKAIRYLLDKTEGNKAKAELTEQIFEIGNDREGPDEQEEEADRDNEEEEEENEEDESPAAENDSDFVYDVAITPVPEDDFDKFRQFEEILKRIMGELIEEKNEKMEQSLRRMVRDELDQFFLLYQDIASEAAAERESAAKKGFFRSLMDFLRR